jgi:transposase
VREVTSWIMTDPDHLPVNDTKNLKAITKRDADLRRLAGHVRAFATMMMKLQGDDRLDDWIATDESDRLAPLASFARNLRRDIDAVRNGLSLPYSSGPVEGCINRIKMLKRQMFGRANIDLLRKRTLLAT